MVCKIVFCSEFPDIPDNAGKVTRRRRRTQAIAKRYAFHANTKIATGFESGLYTGMILIDLQKAFDTVNYDILLKKMEFIGFSDKTTKWFKSYLSNRKFKVYITNTFSEPGNLLCRVPRESILGPLLFLLYRNNMPNGER